ncbi:WG repeat-containing protein [Pedobacter sp.]
MKGYAAYKAKNYNEAFKQYTIAANKGYDVGMVQLGLLYMQGLGVTEDRKETLKWFQKAADIGNINAMFMVGMAYSSGNLGPKDLKIAEQWFLKSANLGKTESMYYMGRLFEYGLAGSLDLNKAKEWYKKAADKGNEDAKQKLISLANNLPTNIKTVAAPPTPIKPIINKNVSWLGKNGLYGIVDRTGKIIVQPQYDNPLGFNKNGIAIVTKNKKKGLINNNGKELTPFEYDSDLGETDGLFLLRKRKPTPDNILNDETYFLDGTGKIVLTDTDKPYKIESPFYSERAMVRTTNGTGYIDKKGKMVISDIYTSGSLIGSSPYWFTDGVAVIKRKENNEIILIDINGKVLTQKNYMTIGGNTSLFIRQQWESIFTYSVTGGKKGYLDKNGKEITAAIYDDVFPFREGRGKVKVGKNTFKQGFVDKAGKEIIPLIYDGVNDFSDGLAAVEVKGRWGFIDVLGNMVIQPQFENVGDFSEGLARVAITQKDGKRRSGFINKKGEWVIAPQFENNFGKFTEGLAGININGYWGFINTKGELVIQPKYKKYGFTSFEDGLKFFEGENYRYFYIDKTGKEFKEQ